MRGRGAEEGVHVEDGTAGKDGVVAGGVVTVDGGVHGHHDQAQGDDAAGVDLGEVSKGDWELMRRRLCRYNVRLLRDHSANM